MEYEFSWMLVELPLFFSVWLVVDCSKYRNKVNGCLSIALCAKLVKIKNFRLFFYRSFTSLCMFFFVVWDHGWSAILLTKWVKGHAIYKAIHGSLPNDSRFCKSCFSTTLIVIMLVYFCDKIYHNHVHCSCYIGNQDYVIPLTGSRTLA